MKMYFNASMSALDEYKQFYQRIIDKLKQMGHQVHANHILEYDQDKRDHETPEERQKYYSDMKKKVKQADIMVAEISYPSTVHVGHEMTLALEYNTPVLALYNKNNRPVLFWGMEDDRFLVEEYDDSNLESIIEQSVQHLSDHMDTRFNFFVSPRQLHYLDTIAKTQRIPRSVFLRRLIEKEMDQDEEYNSA